MGVKSDKWLTLLGFSLACFANGTGFGIITSNLSTFATYYNQTQMIMDSLFAIGTGVQILLCFPALKILQWRFDYAIFAGSFLTAMGFWIMTICGPQFYFTILSNVVLAIGQSLIIGNYLFISERWFDIEERSYVIGLCIYANFTGIYLSAITSAMYIGKNTQRINSQVMAYAILATVVFFITLLTVRNKPKGKKFPQIKTDLKAIKLLWKHKFNTYAVLMGSVFLGMSWSFLSSVSILLNFFTPFKLGIFMFILLLSGISVGLLNCFLINYFIGKAGNNKYYDLLIYITLAIGMLGYLFFGLCVTFQLWNFWLVCLLMVMIGVGGMSSLGIFFLSFAQTMHFTPPLLIDMIIALGASFYSFVINAIALFSTLQIFYLMAATGILPLIYLAVAYRTDFKRYKYFLNVQQARYQLLKINDQEQTDAGKRSQEDKFQ